MGHGNDDKIKISTCRDLLAHVLPHTFVPFREQFRLGEFPHRARFNIVAVVLVLATKTLDMMNRLRAQVRRIEPLERF